MKKDNQKATLITNSSQINKETSHETQAVLAKCQLLYSTFGLILGMVSIIGGIYLFIQGASGSTDWKINILGAESNLVQAAPGAVLFVVGLFIVFVTRYKYKHILAK